MRLRIKNWRKHQHYKVRNPPWIKLYREILDDPQWHQLSGESAKGLIMLWLIASEDDGFIPDSSTIAFRLRISENRAIALLSECSPWFETDASNMLASCYQDASAETEEETDKEFPPTPQRGAHLCIIARYGIDVEVDMGNRKRLPNLEATTGMRAEDLAVYLTNRGFPAKVVVR